jgi:hypothetical protein
LLQAEHYGSPQTELDQFGLGCEWISAFSCVSLSPLPGQKRKGNLDFLP